MSEDYRSMWTSLGLDLEAHDALLGVLGPLYKKTFLSQQNRPEGMAYFDFVMSEIHGLRIKELLNTKATGRRVIGTFCVFVPEELVLALDGVQVGLCAGAEFAPELAEKYIPRNTCALIKGAFGFAAAKVCPYLKVSDLVVGENTCDGKKKSYEVFKELVDDFYVMDLPQMKNPRGRSLLKSEFLKLVGRLEYLTGNRLSVDRLKRGIRFVNAKRAVMARLARLRAADPAPISGLDALLLNQIYFYDDPARFSASVGKICNELEKRIAAQSGVAAPGAKRILISGCPMAVPNWKLPSIIEQAGAVIVGEESCVGERGIREQTDDTPDTVDGLIDAIVDRYFKIDCAIFTPNTSRLENIKMMADAYQADGVVHYNLQFCGPYQLESGPVEKALEANGIPTLRIDTDYSQEDVGQIQTRVEAFLERLPTKR